MMKRDVIEVATAVLGGLGIGAMAMYLFDPDKGVARRKKVREEAQGMVNKASDAVHHAGQTLRQGKSRLQERARQWMPTSMADDTCPVGHAARVAAPIVGALALGAGLMFMLDPVSGRRRRLRAREKAVLYTHNAEDSLVSAGRRVSDRAKGFYQSAKGMMGKHQHNGGHDVATVEEHGQAVQ